MRIISGIHKGRKLQAPKKLPVRPTTDMAKEALFNIIGNTYHLPSIAVLDLFSGTGNISYEFGSRGTQNITSVDANAGCVHYIKTTSAVLELPIVPIKSNVYDFLEKTKQTADIIFADPPYDFKTEQFSKIVTLIFEHNLLNEDGVLIIEHSKHTSLKETEHFSNIRKYGGNCFSFFEK